MHTNEEIHYCLMQAHPPDTFSMPLSSNAWDFVATPGSDMPKISDAPLTVYWHAELDRATVAAMLRAMAQAIEASPQQ